MNSAQLNAIADVFDKTASEIRSINDMHYGEFASKLLVANVIALQGLAISTIISRKESKDVGTAETYLVFQHKAD